MSRNPKPKPRDADWPPGKALPLFRQQLAKLDEFRGRRFSEVEHEEDSWRQFTHNLIVHSFGEGSSNQSEFSSATWAGEHNIMGVSEQQLQVNFELRVKGYESTLRTAIQELEVSEPLTPNPSVPEGPPVFVSHSSKDADLALALVEFLKAGLGLNASQIRCSSVDGYRLPVGVNTESQLRGEVNAADVVIGLVTPSSLSSHFVMFELGARWGAGRFLAPLLAGVSPGELTGPLNLLNALSANNESQLHQLLQDVSSQMGLTPQSPASYVRHLSAVKGTADTITKTQSGREPPSPESSSKFAASVKSAEFGSSPRRDGRATIALNVLVRVQNKGPATTLVISEADITELALEPRMDAYFRDADYGREIEIRAGFLGDVSLFLSLTTTAQNPELPEQLSARIIIEETFSGTVELLFTAKRV